MRHQSPETSPHHEKADHAGWRRRWRTWQSGPTPAAWRVRQRARLLVGGGRTRVRDGVGLRVDAWSRTEDPCSVRGNPARPRRWQGHAEQGEVAGPGRRELLLWIPAAAVVSAPAGVIATTAAASAATPTGAITMPMAAAPRTRSAARATIRGAVTAAIRARTARAASAAGRRSRWW